MKLLATFLLLTVFQANASIYSQSKDLKLSLHNATLLEVLNAIENQSNFKFFYQNEQINISRTVSVNVEGAKVEEILDKLFANENVHYRVLEDNLILLTTERIFQAKLSGTVTSLKDDTPLPGVSIIEKGTTNGAITDLNGSFTLTLQGSNPVLIFSFIGYKTQEVEVGKQTSIHVTMEEDYAQLDEVVVVGYGYQKKSLVTGAISSIKSSEIKTLPIQRAEQILQGKTSGVQVIPVSGAPGAGMNIRIRGYSSNANSNPIFIVDGVRTQDIGYLDPNDIASMEVLKDAASSAIYGAEGANGVILITTKGGTAGRTQITYDFQQSWQDAGKLPKVLNIDQYAQYMSETVPALTVDKTYNTNWLDQIFETGKMSKHHLAFTGGTEKSVFLLSLSYLNNDGIVIGSQDKYERYTIRINSDHKMASWLKVGNNLSYAHTNRNAINENNGEFGGVIGSALQMDPSTPVEFTGTIPASVQTIINDHPTVLKAPNGNYYGISQYNFGEIVNPFVTMAITNGGVKQDNLNGNVYAELTPVKGLTLTSRLGLDLYYQNNHFWRPVYYYTSERNNSASAVIDNNLMNLGWTWENFATITKKIGLHSFTLLAGMSAENIKQRTTNAQGGPMIVNIPTFAELNYVASQASDQIQGTSPEFRKQSYFGRLSYDYKNKYLLQASVRRDAASLAYVPSGGRWGVFPSFSAGWVISNESRFPKQIMSYLKVRGSWGQNGSLSNLFTTPYAYLDGITGSSFQLVMTYPFSSGNITVLEPAAAGNPNLKWETSQQTDIGLDLRILNDRLNFSIDYYNKTTKDLIAIPNLPLEVGFNAPPLNAGTVVNKGFEFDLGYNKAVGEFRYGLNLNLSTLKNKVTYLDPVVGRINGAQVGTGWFATVFEQGSSLWHFLGYKTAGINPANGNPYFVTKDGVLTDANGVNINDMQNIGSPIPKLLFGGTLNLAFKNVDLNVNATGMQGNKVMIGWIRNDRPRVNRPEYFFNNRWTPENTNGTKPGAAADSKTYNSDQLVFNGSFIRIQQIQVGYTFPSAIMRKVKFGSLRLYVSLDNYFTFTKYPGMDPQASPFYTGANSLNNSIGIDRGSYPIPKAIMFGVSASF